MPNPSGENGLAPFTGFIPEVPYGAQQAQDNLHAAAPLAGQQASTSAENAPRRARQAASRPPAPQGTAASQSAPGAAAQGSLPPAPPAVPYDAQVAQIWLQLAQEPGASPLVRQYAQDAAQRVLVGGGAPTLGEASVGAPAGLPS